MIWILKKLIAYVLPVSWVKPIMFSNKIFKIVKLFTMEEKGLLTNKEERWLARFCDNLKKFKNPILEIGDYFFYRGLIKLVDDILLEKTVPENWENPVRKVISLAKANDIDALGELVTSKANEAIDLPFVDEASEELMFRHAYGLLATHIYSGLKWMSNKGQLAPNDEQEA